MEKENGVNKEQIKEPQKPAFLLGAASGCCSSEIIPPDWDMAEKMGSLWGAYACYICKKCGKVCEPVGAPQ